MRVSAGRLPFLFVTFCCTIMFIGPRIVDAEEQVPLSQMEETVNKIIDILQEGSGEEKWQQQKKEIVALIDKRLNREEIARRALARHWRDLNSRQKEEFSTLFLELLKDTYINRLRNCSCENEARFYEQRKRGDRAIVYSMAIKDKQEVPIDYRLVKKDGEWGVYDIVVEGVSLISNYRKQFDQIMSRDGYSELIKRLREKTGN